HLELRAPTPDADPGPGRPAGRAAEHGDSVRPGVCFGHCGLAAFATAHLATGGTGQQPGPAPTVEYADSLDSRPRRGHRGPECCDGPRGEQAEAGGFLAAVDPFGCG